MDLYFTGPLHIPYLHVWAKNKSIYCGFIRENYISAKGRDEQFFGSSHSLAFKLVTWIDIYSPQSRISHLRGQM